MSLGQSHRILRLNFFSFKKLNSSYFMWQLHKQVSLKKTTLLRYNSHTYLKYISQWFWIHSQNCVKKASPPLVLEHFHNSRKKLCAHQQSLPMSYQPLSAAVGMSVCFLSLWVGPFWTFHVHWIVHMWSFMPNFFNLACFQGSSML